MDRPCARYPELPIVRSCKQEKRSLNRNATLFKTFFCCRIFVKFLEGDLIWARIPSSICCGCCSFHSIPFIVKEKEKKVLIHPSKKEAINATFLFSSHHIKSLRSVPADVRSRHIYFLRKEQPSVRRALPPVG